MASSMALAMTAPTALMPASPPPLRPSGLRGLGASSVMSVSMARDVRQRRHQVIGEGDGERIAVLAIGELLEERAAEALDGAADELALEHHRIDGAADIVGDHQALDSDAAGAGIDAHHREMGAERKHRVLGRKPGLRREPGIAARQQVRGRADAAREIAERDRGTAGKGPPRRGPPGIPRFRTTPSTMSSSAAGVCSSSAA